MLYLQTLHHVRVERISLLKINLMSRAVLVEKLELGGKESSHRVSQEILKFTNFADSSQVHHFGTGRRKL